MPEEKKSWLQEWEKKEGKAWNSLDYVKTIPEWKRASYALESASINGDIKKVRESINKGANVNITHGLSRTP